MSYHRILHTFLKRKTSIHLAIWKYVRILNTAGKTFCEKRYADVIGQYSRDYPRQLNGWNNQLGICDTMET